MVTVDIITFDVANESLSVSMDQDLVSLTSFLSLSGVICEMAMSTPFLYSSNSSGSDNNWMRGVGPSCSNVCGFQCPSVVYPVGQSVDFK